MAVTIEEFDAVRVTEFGIKFKDDDAASLFGCVGKVEGTAEVSRIVKKCEGVEKKSKSKVRKMVITLSAHVRLDAHRRLLGIKTAGLKAGVYKYGADSVGEDFTLTAVAIDEFEDEQKLIAFSNCSNNTGLTITIENGLEEVAELSLEFTAMIDDKQGIYYEAYLAELEAAGKDDFISSWKTNFTPDLALATDTP
ncbi:MAG: phage tail protein [Solibacillus sp.]